MLAIRLTRKGSKKRPSYRVIVTEKSNPRDGRFLEIVGHYNPLPETAEVTLNMDRVQYWLSKGAQPTDTVRNLIKKAAVSPATPENPSSSS